MSKAKSPFRYFHSSPEVIRLVVMLYVRFPLSLRNVEDLLFERGIDLCHETVRLWWNRFGPLFAADIRRQRVSRMRGFRHWKWDLDEVHVKINGEMHYLWRAVDHEGEVLESYVTKKRDKTAALRLLKKALKRHGKAETIVTDGLKSYPAAMRELGNLDRREMGRWLNNRAENSHLPFRRRERAMLRFRQMKTLQKFASVHANVHNHFSAQRHLATDKHSKLAARQHLPSGKISWPDPRSSKAEMGQVETSCHPTDSAIECVLRTLGLAVKKFPMDEKRVRWEINPWAVEAALARLEDRKLTEAEQREVWNCTRTPHKVTWPEWWTVRA